jgi:hypothetical protein
MTTINRSNSHSLSGLRSGRRSRRNGPTSLHRLRPQLISDGVVAGYIHEISTRRTTSQARRSREPERATASRGQRELTGS